MRPIPRFGALLCWLLEDADHVERRADNSRGPGAHRRWLPGSSPDRESAIVKALALVAGPLARLPDLLLTELSPQVEPYHSLHCRPRQLVLDSVIPMISGGYQG
jgi:hypothetical protein